MFVWAMFGFGVLMPFSTYASTDSFTIQSAVMNSDTEPPMTPSISSATPVTSSQIDIVWGAVTDNVFVGGYQVFRDAVQVATTTLLSFSDTGLTPSTTYTYTVRAFDSSNNLSTTSVGISTSTYALAVVSTPSPSSSGGRRLMFDPVELVSFDISPSVHGATFSWETNEHSRYSLRWGRTTSYELGYVESEVYSTDHSTTITGLDAGTTYQYELIAYNDFGKEYVLARDHVTTENGPDTTAPANVTNLRAMQFGDAVRLVWDNPRDSDFSHVSVIRSHYFYPTHPNEGFLVYSGSGKRASDLSPFEFGPLQYYSVFAYDTNGNRSSGAVVSITKQGDAGSGVFEKPALESEGDLSQDTQLNRINFNDFQFIQDGSVLNEGGSDILVDGTKSLVVSIPYDTLPRHLKSIVLTLKHPTDTNLSFSFLLRVNKDSTAYEAKIAPLYEEGMFTIDIAVFDFVGQEMKEVSGSMWVAYDTTESRSMSTRFFSTELFFVVGVVVGVSLIMFILFLLVRRRSRGE